MVAGRKRLGVLLSALAGFVLLTAVAKGQPPAPTVDDSAAAYAVIGEINQWRLDNNIAPLKPNETLHQLALYQATYLSTLTEIVGGDTMHIDGLGRGPRERAGVEPFNWPGYGGPANVAISEIAYVGQTESAFEFWRGSQIHTETALQPVVREIGVAAVVHPWGHIYIVVFGSRPDVLPALVDPAGKTVYLTTDAYQYGAGAVPSMQINLFDGAGRPLNAGTPLPWTPIIALPENVGNSLYILYGDGVHQSMSEVDLTRDWVVLPGQIPPGVVPAA